MMNKGFAILCLLTLLFGCKRENPTSWSTQELIPLAHGTLNLGNLVPDSLLSSDDTGLLHFYLDESLTDFNLDSLVQIPDTNIHRSFTSGLSGGPFEIPQGTSVLDQEDQNVFAVSEAELKEVLLKGGMLEYTMYNHMNGQLVMDYSIPGAVKNGEPVAFTEVLPPGSGANPSVVQGTIDLTDYRIDFSGPTGTSSNTLVSIFNATVDPNGPGAASIFGDDSLVLDVKFVQAAVHYGKGYFGHHNIEVRDTADFTLLNSLAGGSLTLGEVDLSLEIVNKVGADAQIQINGIKGNNTFNDNLETLDNVSLADQINITRAFDNNGTVEPTYYSIALDENNSNIPVFLSNMPNQLIMDVDIEVNPLGNVAANNDFIYTDQPLEARLVADIPLCVRLENLKIRDTLDIENSLDFVAHGKLFLYVKNSFPFAATVSAEVIDAEGNSVATLASEESMASGFYDGASMQSDLVESTLELTFAEGVINNITDTNRIVITVVFDSYGDEVVKLTAANELEISIVADLDAILEIE
ncbi:MAG: hypothetical protein ACI84C_001289 [Flavobacteriales bacterium]|jgi:hypothetical protein